MALTKDYSVEIKKRQKEIRELNEEWRKELVKDYKSLEGRYFQIETKSIGYVKKVNMVTDMVNQRFECSGFVISYSEYGFSIGEKSIFHMSEYIVEKCETTKERFASKFQEIMKQLEGIV